MVITGSYPTCEIAANTVWSRKMIALIRGYFIALVLICMMLSSLPSSAAGFEASVDTESAGIACSESEPVGPVTCSASDSLHEAQAISSAGSIGLQAQATWPGSNFLRETNASGAMSGNVRFDDLSDPLGTGNIALTLPFSLSGACDIGGSGNSAQICDIFIRVELDGEVKTGSWHYESGVTNSGILSGIPGLSFNEILLVDFSAVALNQDVFMRVDFDIGVVAGTAGAGPASTTNMDFLNTLEFASAGSVFSGLGGNITSNSLDFMIEDNVWLAGQVPLPSAVWLFGSSLLGLAGIARRRRVA